MGHRSFFGYQRLPRESLTHVVDRIVESEIERHGMRPGEILADGSVVEQLGGECRGIRVRTSERCREPTCRPESLYVEQPSRY